MSSSLDSESGQYQVDYSYQSGVLKWREPSRPVTQRNQKLEDSNVLYVLKDDSPNKYKVLRWFARDESEPESVNVTNFENLSNIPAEFLARHLLLKLPSHLSLPAEDLHIIISTKSGLGKAWETSQVLLSALDDANGREFEDPAPYTVLETTNEQSIMTFARDVLKPKADKGIPQTVVLLSGDGGVVDIINELAGDGERSATYLRPTLSLIPLGTGNAIFHSLARPPAPTTPLPYSISILFHGHPRPLPIFRATFSSATLLTPTKSGLTCTPLPHNVLYGAIVASYGLHASLIADSDTPEYRKFGAKRFGMAAEELLKEVHPYRAKVVLRKRVTNSNGTEIVVEERVQRETHGYVLATLVSNLEHNFRISPKSEPFDGRLRVVHFGAEPKEKVMAIMGAAYRGGRHVEEFADVLGYEEVVGLRIVFGEKEERWRRVCVDGLIVVVEEDGWVDVEVVSRGDEIVDVLAP